MMIAVALAAAAALEGDPRCAALAAIALPAARVEATEPIAIRGGSACRLRGLASPVTGSRIRFELWLPRAGWNGRYYQLGNGGFGGTIHTPSLAAEAARGNAAAATDTGHEGDGFDARWAAGNAVAVEDYGHRAIKATADAAARLVAAYYSRPADHRYFAGCSNGGRQALKAAELYPADWDGILAGAPAAGWTRQLESFASLQSWLRGRPERWLGPAQLLLIQSRALAACPAGSVAGGVALAPQSCLLAPDRLLCRRGARSGCLTPAQAESLRRIMAAGFEPTAAFYPDGWARWIVNPDPEAPSQRAFAEGAFRFLFADRPRWRATDYAPGRDRPSPALRATLDASPAGLAAYRARGGRILSYFGWADPVLSPREGLSFYRAVARRLGPKATSGFYRLFMIPGMDHCQSGLGPTAFGQSLPAPARAADPLHDIRAALEAWVEQGVAPDTLIAWDPAGGAERRIPVIAPESNR